MLWIAALKEIVCSVKFVCCLIIIIKPHPYWSYMYPISHFNLHCNIVYLYVVRSMPFGKPFPFQHHSVYFVPDCFNSFIWRYTVYMISSGLVNMNISDSMIFMLLLIVFIALFPRSVERNLHVMYPPSSRLYFSSFIRIEMKALWHSAEVLNPHPCAQCRPFEQQIECSSLSSWSV